MHALSDRDVAYDLLYGCKSSSHMYMQAVLESASPRCREVFHRIHDDGLRSQWRIWKFLHNRNEYQAETAQRSEIDSVRQRMDHLCQTHQEAVRPHFAMAGTRESDGRWSDGNRYDEGRWNESGQMSYSGAARGGYATGAYGQGNPGAGTGYGGGTHFEPGRNMPEGTRFEGERSSLEGFDGARRQGAWGDGGYGERNRGSSLGMAGGRTGSSLNAPWGERSERDNTTRRGVSEGSFNETGARRTTATAPRY